MKMNKLCMKMKFKKGLEIKISIAFCFYVLKSNRIEAYEEYSFVFNFPPVKITVIIGLSKQKKANGKYVSTGTPSTSAINTPQTLHGTSGLITVPASSNVLDRAFAGRFAC